jgi:hypothetical protein
MRARFMVAIISLALLYASTCSAGCANCFIAGPRAAAAAQSQDCGHAARVPMRGAQQQAPARPDCSGHHHSSFDVVQSDGLLLIQLSAMGSARQLFVAAVSGEVVNVASSSLSDLAPPRDSTISPQRKSSILRI